MSRVAWTAALLALAIFVLVACGDRAPGVAADDCGPTSAPKADGDLVNPTLRLRTIDGECFDLAQRRGEWTVVNFWATWCAPCLKEIPDLSALHDRRDDLGVIGLAYEDIGVEAMRDFLVRVPARYPVAILDPYAPAPAGDFEAPRGLPMTYLVGPDGAIAWRFLGPVTSEDIEQAIEAAAGS